MEALFYFRISYDTTGERLGVERQEPPCLELCEKLGFSPGKRYIDNDISATTGEVRPDFERLLADLKEHPRPVIVWHTDRLVRVTRDLERVIETGVNVHAVHAGHFDLSTPAGRAVARTLTAWAQYEGEQKSIRQKASNRQRAEKGKPWWPSRPFGFEMDTTHNRKEASALKRVYAKLVAGASLRQLATELNEAGMLTPKGNQWTGAALRVVLLNPRNAAIRTYNGEEVGPAGWTPIVTEETFRAAERILSDESRATHGGGRRCNLLTGVLRCAVCDSTCKVKWIGGKAEGYAVYTCKTMKHVSVRVTWMDEYVSELARLRLASPEGQAVWTGDQEESAEEVLATIQELRARLDDVMDAFTDGEITREQMKKGSEKLREQLIEAEAALQRTGRSEALNGAQMDPAGILRRWEMLGMDIQRFVIETLIERVAIKQRPKGARRVLSSDIELAWA